MSQRVEMILDVNENQTSSMDSVKFPACLCDVWRHHPGSGADRFPDFRRVVCVRIGTIIYSCITRFKVPVYLGSSFAYISAVQIAVAAMSGDVSAAQTGLILIGLVYVVVSILSVSLARTGLTSCFRRLSSVR